MTTLVLLIICAVALPILVTGDCTLQPCRNGGTCETGYKEIMGRCKCPYSDSLIYGPYCEIENIGFHASVEGKDILSAFNKHLIQVLDIHKYINIKFEFIGRCYKKKECPILILKNRNNRHFLTVSVYMYNSSDNQHYLKVQFNPGKKELVNNISHVLSKSINTDEWMAVTIEVRENMILTEVISLYPTKDDNVAKWSQFYSFLDIKKLFSESILLIGGFYGCVRFVIINELPVDLGSFTLHRNSVPINKSDYNKYASHFCYPTAKSCHSSKSQLDEHIFDSSSRTKCGANSKCDGALDSGMGCSCRCDIGKRSRLETLINRDRCWQNLTEQDECVDDTTIISTSQSDFQLKWEASDSKCLNISAHDFSIEFMMLTRQVNVTSMLELEGVFSIKIANGYLQLCISGNANCYLFPSLNVSDDVWHVVSVDKKCSQVLLTIDSKIMKRNVLDATISNFICQCEIMLPNSCIRGLRISDVAMPLRETDKVIDYSGKPIVFHKGSSVSVDDHCNFNKTGLTPPYGSRLNSKSSVVEDVRKVLNSTFTDGGNILRANWMVIITAVLTLVAYSVC